MDKKPPLIAVMGPTASGKTEIAISLAKRYNAEIVSADSMQIYKGIAIGTAQPTKEEMEQIPHHLIAFKELDEEFSAAQYVTLARDIIANINARGKLAILCGGTGLYINSLTGNMEFSDIKKDESVKLLLEQIYKEKGKEALYSMLLELDPQEAGIIDKDNPVRLIRALTVCKLTGRPVTEYKQRNLQGNSYYNTLKIGIDYSDRNELYDRINKRVTLMLNDGLLEEASCLLKCKSAKTALQAIGYKELDEYFSGEITLEAALDRIRQASRRYAKRQLTWFRRDKEINWFYKTAQTDLESYKKTIFDLTDQFLQSQI